MPPARPGSSRNLNYVQVVATSAESTAYLAGTAASHTGRRAGGEFRRGGRAGVAYQDITAGNAGGQYRATDVDIEVTADTGGGYNVGWMDPGEWLDYSVTVAAAGSYRLDLRVAALGAGGRLHVAFGGVDKTGPVTIPDTGSWQAWTTVSVPVTLAAGAQRMRVSIDAATGGIVGNLNYVQVVAAARRRHRRRAVTLSSTPAMCRRPRSTAPGRGRGSRPRRSAETRSRRMMAWPTS